MIQLRKIVGLFFCIINLNQQCWSYAVVFVHIGNELPGYLATAIKQVRLFNTCPVYLLASKQALLTRQQELAALQVTPVPLQCLIRSNYHHHFHQNTPFARGFWRYASERFFYLHEFMRQFNIEDVFHLENDVMLYADLAQLLPIFKDWYPAIAATFDNDQRCIPGIMYIAHASALEKLVSFWQQQAAQGDNDMALIAKFKHEYGIEYIEHLPIVPPDYVLKYPLMSPQKHVVVDMSDYFNNFDEFNSIFDAAAIGQYMGGIAPCHGVPKPGFINESCVVNPSYFTYCWLADEQGRKIPYLIFENEQIRINNLHIHSKQLDKFLSR